MNKLKINILDCRLGNVLAKDVIINYEGLKLAEKDTIINDFIKNKLIRMGIKIIWIYDVCKLEQRNVKNINCHKIKICYKESISSLKAIFDVLEAAKPLSVNKINDIAKLVYKSIDNTDEIIKYLFQIKEYEDYTLFHSVNVSFYAMLIGKWMCMPEDKILDLIVAGFLHDVGKLAVPERILNKNGSLTDEEFEIMKSHTTFGYGMLKDVIGLSDEIKKSVLMHHERMDGLGYPKGISGDDIGEYSKIIAIADIYDAMTTDRVYKKRVSPFEAFQMFLETGMSTLEPSIVNLFILNLASHILGVKAKLDDGEVLQVVDDFSDDFPMENYSNFNV